MVKLCKCGCETEIADNRTWVKGHHRRGKKHSVTTCEKISESLIGNTNTLGYKREVSTSTRKKLSEASTGNTNWLGRKHTDKTREMISESKKENFNNPDFKERHHMWYNGVDPDDGVVMLSPYSHRMGHAFLRACNIEIKKINNSNPTDPLIEAIA